MRTIKAKMIVSFLIILLVSCTITFIGAVLFSNQSISDEIKASQFSFANSLLEFKARTELSTIELLDVTVNSMYNTRILDALERESLDEALLERIEHGELVFVSKRVPVSTTYFKLGEEYIKITVRDQDLFAVFRFRVALILGSILLLSCIILLLGAGKMLRPIHKLTAATQRVAKGEFDVFVETKNKDEIGFLTRNFNQMVKELKKIEYLQKDFIRNVSHEFKTPIASIQGFAKLLQRDSLSREERLEFSGIILEESERLSKLSSNILRLSKLENQDTLLSQKEFILDEQLRTVMVLLEPKWSQKELQLDIQMEKTPYCGDEELLQQVWMNLIENAIKFSNPRGSISISIAKQLQFIEVKIADTGMGMDKETEQRIFDKFFQGNASHSVEGNGLGLSIVKRILDLCHGEIHVESALDHGTVFTVRLPSTPSALNTLLRKTSAISLSN